MLGFLYVLNCHMLAGSWADLWTLVSLAHVLCFATACLLLSMLRYTIGYVCTCVYACMQLKSARHKGSTIGVGRITYYQTYSFFVLSFSMLHPKALF